MAAAYSLLIAVHHFPPERSAGAELLAYRTARWFQSHGHRVRVVCVRACRTEGDGSLQVVDELVDGIPVHRLPLEWVIDPNEMVSEFDSPHVTQFFDELFRRDKPDILNLISGYLMGSAPLRAAERAGVATMVTLTDFWFLCPTIQLLRADGSLCPGPEPLECVRCVQSTRRAYRIANQYAPRLTRAGTDWASRLPAAIPALGFASLRRQLASRQAHLQHTLDTVDAIAIVTEFAGRLHRENGITHPHMFHTPYSVPAIKVPSERGDPETIHFGYLGQIASVKGIDLLINAFRKLDKTRQRAKLWIYGPLETAERDYVIRLKQLIGDDRDIILAGAFASAELAATLANLDVVVVPSRWYENSPHVVLEAFAARRPVIASRVGGIAEIVRDEVNGLLFDRNNINDLTRQMQCILDNPKLLQRLAANIPPVPTLDEEMERLDRALTWALEHRRTNSVTQSTPT